jgi:DNA-binding MarR family transcriptional regulator
MIQTELAHILEIGKVSVGGLIDRLEEAGLVYRKNDPADRRVKRIFITAKGEEILDHIALVGEKLDRILFQDISNEELNTTADVIARVKNNIRGALKAPAITLDALPPSGKTPRAEPVTATGTKPELASAD